ncbi:MAG: prepilin peptidase, partial [Pygmaiobacter sp.]
MNLFFIVLVFLFGVVIGSFLNVLIYRLPLGISVAHGFSMCPVCEHRLYPADLVPVVSWLFLGGKCRYCKAPIAPIYPFVELLNGVLWVAMAFRFGLSVECAAFAVV